MIKQTTFFGAEFPFNPTWRGGGHNAPPPWLEIAGIKLKNILGAGSAWLFLKFTLATFRNKTGKKMPPGRPGGNFCEIFLVKRGGAIMPPPPTKILRMTLKLQIKESNRKDVIDLLILNEKKQSLSSWRQNLTSQRHLPVYG